MQKGGGLFFHMLLLLLFSELLVHLQLCQNKMVVNRLLCQLKAKCFYKFMSSFFPFLLFSKCSIHYKLLTELCISLFVDLTPVNVVAKVFGPRKVLVKWDPPAHADSTIKGYKVYQR